MYSENENILRNALKNYHVLNDDEFMDFLEICEFKSFAKKEYLLASGSFNYGLYFVISGIVGLNELVDGKEVFQDFFQHSEFAFELKSLTSQQHSTKNLITLEPSTVYFLNRKKLLALYEKSHSYEKLGRKLLEHLLSRNNDLSYVLQALKPIERYQYLEKNRPDLLHTIPLTYLASYLGIARETLSRIRAKK